MGAGGIGLSELAMMMLLVLVVARASKLPGAGDLFGRLMRGRDLTKARFHAHGASRQWKPLDWLLLGATIALGAAVAFNYALG